MVEEVQTKFVVWDEIQKHAAHPVKPKPNEEPHIARDPLTSFENFIYSLRTDLSGWMTFSKRDRLDRCKWWVDTYVDTAMKVTPDRRHKALCFIIFMESHHPLGDSQVAAVAFNGLFPGHVGKKAKKQEEPENGSENG